MKIEIPKTIFGREVKGATERALKASQTQPPIDIPTPNLQPTNANDPVIMSYDHPEHGEFFQELIAKVNEVYSGTGAEIPVRTSGEVQGNLIKRAKLITTIYENQNLKDYGLFPITPLQSEQLLKDGKLPSPENYWEDLAFLLYDIKGSNKKEAEALRKSIKNNLSNLGLSQSDLEKRLVVVNAGLEIDSNMSHGVKPMILQGLTKVYAHEVLDKTGENHKFEYGLDRGLPSVNQLGQGDRTLYMPSGNKFGLRVLYRFRVLVLSAWVDDLADSSVNGRVTFARSASP